jgi:FkbM family methyltransferase
LTISIDQAAELFHLQDTHGVFESLIEACYSGVLKAGDAAVDGGAHIGMHTLPMARLVGESGKVFAFEPIHPLAATIANGAASMPQVSVIEAALSNKVGSTRFQYFTEEPWYSSIAERSFENKKIVETITVSQFILDELADQPIRFIKLDLESGEFHALQGATELLRRQQPVIALECGRSDSAKAAGYSKADYFQLFEELGYRLLDLFGRPFTESDFARPHDDKFVPHYLVGITENFTEWSTRLQANALSELPDNHQDKNRHA